MTGAPIQERYRAMMNGIAEGLDEIFNGKGKAEPKRVGFVLLTFEFGRTEGGRVNYISNANRADQIAAMKEWIARAEGRYSEPDSEAPS